MKKYVKFSVAIILISLFALTLASCGSGKQLDAYYDGEKASLNFYQGYLGNTVEIGTVFYDEAMDIDCYKPYLGTYKIYPDPENSDQLLIEIKIYGYSTFIYSFEESVSTDGQDTIIINGDEFTLYSKHNSNYGIRKILYNMGIIDTLE